MSRLKLLADLQSPMLDFMAPYRMVDEAPLYSITAGTAEDEGQA